MVTRLAHPFLGSAPVAHGGFSSPTATSAAAQVGAGHLGRDHYALLEVLGLPPEASNHGPRTDDFPIGRATKTLNKIYLSVAAILGAASVASWIATSFVPPIQTLAMLVGGGLVLAGGVKEAFLFIRARGEVSVWRGKHGQIAGAVATLSSRETYIEYTSENPQVMVENLRALRELAEGAIKDLERCAREKKDAVTDIGKLLDEGLRLNALDEDPKATETLERMQAAYEVDNTEIGETEIPALQAALKSIAEVLIPEAERLAEARRTIAEWRREVARVIQRELARGEASDRTRAEARRIAEGVLALKEQVLTAKARAEVDALRLPDFGETGDGVTEYLRGRREERMRSARSVTEEQQGTGDTS